MFLYAIVSQAVEKWRTISLISNICHVFFSYSMKVWTKRCSQKNISVCSGHHKRCRESEINIWWSWLDFLLILCKYLTWNLKLQIFCPGDVGHIIMKLILVDDILLQMENRILVLLFFLMWVRGHGALCSHLVRYFYNLPRLCCMKEWTFNFQYRLAWITNNTKLTITESTRN